MEDFLINEKNNLYIYFTFSLINCVFTQELPNISFDDYMLDKDSLIGKTIKIKGYCRNSYSDKFFYTRVMNLKI